MAGILGFYTSKGLVKIVNIRKVARKISPDTAARLKVLFPGMPLDSVTIIYNAWLPAHIFNKAIEGMTFHNTIYVTRYHIQHNYAGFILLIHELVHIKQIRESGEIAFACNYGMQLLSYGGYSSKMPLENEAYAFVAHIPFDPLYYRIRHLQHQVSSADPDWEMTAMAHFLDQGIYLGLQSSNDFNIKSYIDKIRDFPDTIHPVDYPAALLHCIKHASNERKKD